MLHKTQTPTFFGAVKNLWNGLKLQTAKFSSYNAALPNKVQAPATRIGTNPNSSYSQQQRLRLSIEGENAVKNTPFGVNYIYTRRAYCSGQIAWNPDTGDAALDEEVANVCNAEWSDMGIECSMQDAFSRVADVYLPVSGDSALQWYRDEGRLRLLEITADRIGEQFALSNVLPATAKIGDVTIDGTYIAGTLWVGPKIAAYKIYQRNGDASYVNPEWVQSPDIIFFKDDITGGVRGVSKFAAALEDVNSRYQILKSTKDTMQMQSKIAAIASNNSGSPSEYDFQTVQGTDGTIDYVESFADGAVVKYQFNGDSYQVLKSETPSDSFLSGLKYVDAQASLAMGMSPAFLIGSSDFGGASVRLEIEKASREITRIREHVHRPRLNKIAYVTIMDLVARGKLPAKANITRGSWHFGTLPTADAFRDSKADIDSIRAGTTTRGRVIAANSGDTFSRMLRQTTQETIAIHKAVQDANRELERSVSPIDGKPYQPTASIVDIALSTDNPPQHQPALSEKAQGKLEVAKMSAFMGDISISELPASVQESILKFMPSVNEHTRVSRYGMTADELEKKADPHNLESAKRNIRYTAGYAASDEVHANDEKCILLVNDRIVDGHHFLAKALKGKVTKSLPVIDLTPIRFQNQPTNPAASPAPVNA